MLKAAHISPQITTKLIHHQEYHHNALPTASKIQVKTYSVKQYKYVTEIIP
jgi:hypothetical protein